MINNSTELKDIYDKRYMAGYRANLNGYEIARWYALEDFIPQRHPFIKVQHKLTDYFGGLNQVSIAFKVKEGTIFTADFLEKIISATEDLSLAETAGSRSGVE